MKTSHTGRSRSRSRKRVDGREDFRVGDRVKITKCDKSGFSGKKCKVVKYIEEKDKYLLALEKNSSKDTKVTSAQMILLSPNHTSSSNRSSRKRSKSLGSDGSSYTASESWTNSTGRHRKKSRNGMYLTDEDRAFLNKLEAQETSLKNMQTLVTNCTSSRQELITLYKEKNKHDDGYRTKLTDRLGKLQQLRDRFLTCSKANPKPRKGRSSNDRDVLSKYTGRSTLTEDSDRLVKDLAAVCAMLSHKLLNSSVCKTSL